MHDVIQEKELLNRIQLWFPDGACVCVCTLFLKRKNPETEVFIKCSHGEGCDGNFTALYQKCKVDEIWGKKIFHVGGRN